MSGPPVDVGVAALAHVLGEPVDVAAAAAAYTQDLDRLRSWEYRAFHRAGPGVGVTDLAVVAGGTALDRAGLSAADVDLVVLAIPDLAEYLYWDPAAHTQARLGAHRAEAVLLNQACGGGVAAFDTVAGRFATHPEYRTALLIGGNRVCEPYWNRMEVNTSVFSDGAAAAVLVRDHDRCRWLATETITDGRYAGFMRMPVGGAAQPFTPDGGTPRVGDPADRLNEFFAGDVRRMFRFVATIRERNRQVVETACTRAGVTLADVHRFVHFHDNARQFAELAKDLGVPLERTNVELALAHGHIGCADQLIGLERHLDSGELTDGDVVALTSTGSGMHWVCTLLRV
ncbi:3-oxoacyl-ACP synthase III family protein [Micromonospora sp. MH99]|uniref:3-oxoacyl-ACP synthase III family protein n=1 Tax=Micromonospora sp. MH99 TaxID=1945510 RepID=UPI001F1C57DE|nr:3-oxoacyl-[acyl-carrier-protein] synthase III C-terminal domain-containing protein [Micromonospora sp. MH99]MCF0097241.1 3-oxoacyl-[acyl-carrier-protein] synthase 3 [Micromonospora sp. MH99]